MSGILVVDDNLQNRYLLESALHGFGYKVILARNGAEALDLAKKQPPDLVISDILMPEMDGYELCRRWKADERLKPIPFIFYTATYTEFKDEDFGLALGADRFLIKPAKIEVLQKAVREVLEDARNGKVAVPEKPAEDSGSLREYNSVLFRKLQQKVAQLQEEIAARDRAEETLRESESRFRSLVEAAPEGIFVHCGERFLYLNPAMVRLLGAGSREELYGKYFMDWIAPEYREAVRERVRARLETGRPTPAAEQQFLRCDGSRIWVEASAVPIRYGGLDASLVFVRDIAERKRMETDLLQAQKMESVGRLAGSVAHDFNNMLTTIIGCAEFIMKDAKKNAQVREDAGTILAVSDRAAALTHQLLAFSRKQVLNPVVLDLNGAVGGTIKMLNRLIGEDIRLETRLAQRPCPVKVDAGQISQVLLNLTVNARDAMPKGGTLVIETGVAADLPGSFFSDRPALKPGPLVTLSVSDTGVGMSDEVRSHAFEPFFTTKPPEKGTGLGLATIYGIIKQSGGEIELESAPDKGTTFRIYFPLADGKPAADAEAGAAALRGSETILVIEDDQGIRKLAERALAAKGYNVISAPGGKEAFELLDRRGKPVDLVITDVVMPGMSGRDAAKEIARRELSGRTLYISGYADNTAVRHGVVDPDMSFLHKPFSTDKLLSKVREVLDGPAGKAKA